MTGAMVPCQTIPLSINESLSDQVQPNFVFFRIMSLLRAATCQLAAAAATTTATRSLAVTATFMGPKKKKGKGGGGKAVKLEPRKASQVC